MHVQQPSALGEWTEVRWSCWISTLSLSQAVTIIIIISASAAWLSVCRAVVQMLLSWLFLSFLSRHQFAGFPMFLLTLQGCWGRESDTLFCAGQFFKEPPFYWSSLLQCVNHLAATKRPAHGITVCFSCKPSISGKHCTKETADVKQSLEIMKKTGHIMTTQATILSFYVLVFSLPF